MLNAAKLDIPPFKIVRYAQNDKWEQHLITAYDGASPQGEALKSVEQKNAPWKNSQGAPFLNFQALAN